MKKNVYLLTVLILLCCHFSFAAEFADVAEDHWAYQYISALSDDGVINGYEDGTFKPEGTITHGEFIKLVVASCMEDSVDISSASGELTNWARDYVKIAENYGTIEKGIITDENIGLPITRIEMARLIANADMKMMNNKDSGDYVSTLTDITNLSSEDKLVISYCCSNGLIKGYEDNTFRPDKFMSRAEASTMIYRFITKNKEKEKLVEVSPKTIPNTIASNSNEAQPTPEPTVTKYKRKKGKFNPKEVFNLF